MWQESAIRIATVTVAVVLLLEVLKWLRPRLESNKVALRGALLVLCALGVAATDWLPDGQVDWGAAVTVWAATVAGAETSYQWIVKWLRKLLGRDGALGPLVLALMLVTILAGPGPCLAQETPEPGQLWDSQAAAGLTLNRGRVSMIADWSLLVIPKEDWPVYLDVMRYEGDLALGLSTPANSLLAPLCDWIGLTISEPAQKWLDYFAVGVVIMQEGDGSIDGGPFLKARVVKVEF